MKFVLLAVAGALAPLTLLAFPGGAEAAKFANPAKFNSGQIVQFAPFKSNGSKVLFSSDWLKKDGFARISVKNRYGTAEYVVRKSKPKYSRIASKDRKFGRTDLKFEPALQKHVRIKINHNRCAKGKRVKAVVQGGYLNGKVNFNGEGGYVRVKRKLHNEWANRVLMKLPKCAMKTPRPARLKGKGAELTLSTESVVLHMVSKDRKFNAVTADLLAYKKSGNTEIFRDSSVNVKDAYFDMPNYPGLDVVATGAMNDRLEGTMALTRRIDGSYAIKGDFTAHFVGRHNTYLTSKNLSVDLRLFGFAPSTLGVLARPVTATDTWKARQAGPQYRLPTMPEPR